MVKKIGIDIDGTITTMDTILGVFNRETGKNLSINDIVEYDVGKCYGLSRGDAGRIWGTFMGEIVEGSVPIKGLDTFMEYWRTYKNLEGNNELYIVTARPKEFKDSTVDWLARHGVNYDEIYLGYDHKLDAVRDLGLDVFIDDKLDNIVDIDNSGLGCLAYLQDQPYNRDYRTNRRLTSNYFAIKGLV